MPRVWVASQFGDADYICGQLLDLAFSSAALKYAGLKRTALSKSSTLTKLHSSECSDMHLRKRVHVKSSFSSAWGRPTSAARVPGEGAG